MVAPQQEDLVWQQDLLGEQIGKDLGMDRAIEEIPRGSMNRGRRSLQGTGSFRGSGACRGATGPSRRTGGPPCCRGSLQRCREEISVPGSVVPPSGSRLRIESGDRFVRTRSHWRMNRLANSGVEKESIGKGPEQALMISSLYWSLSFSISLLVSRRSPDTWLAALWDHNDGTTNYLEILCWITVF